MIEHILHKEQVLAIIIRDRFRDPGITFVTPGSYSQQLAYMNHPEGKTIAPHRHNPVSRKIELTNEVLFIKKGTLRVDFYADDDTYLRSLNLSAGDTILLVSGGHGFKVLEPIEMIEVKQGPYAGEGDKTRFEPISDEDVRYGE